MAKTKPLLDDRQCRVLRYFLNPLIANTLLAAALFCTALNHAYINWQL